MTWAVKTVYRKKLVTLRSEPYFFICFVGAKSLRHTVERAVHKNTHLIDE